PDERVSLARLLSRGACGAGASGRTAARDPVQRRAANARGRGRLERARRRARARDLGRPRENLQARARGVRARSRDPRRPRRRAPRLRRGASERWGVGGHLGAPNKKALPLAELLPLHVGPELLGHDRGSDRAAAENGLERVLAAFEADVITAERLLALRHVPSSFRRCEPPASSSPGYYYHMYEGRETKNPTGGASPPTEIYPLPLYAELPRSALSRETPASPRARTSAAAP